jgi:hypothetical protein
MSDEAYETTVTYIRLPMDLRLKAEQIAIAEDRTLHSALRMLIREALRARAEKFQAGQVARGAEASTEFQRYEKLLDDPVFVALLPELVEATQSNTSSKGVNSGAENLIVDGIDKSV